MARALVVSSRSTRADRLGDEVVRRFRQRGWSVDRAPNTTPDGAGDVVRDHLASDHGMVVAVGGDGTIGQIAGALAGSGTPLAIVPAGSGNLLAGNLGISGGIDGAVRTAMGGQTRQIDLGRLELPGRASPFVVAAGIGFDAAVMDATTTARKRQMGKLAYLLTSLRLAPSVRNVPIELTIEGATVTTTAAALFIANVGSMAGWLTPRRPVSPDDGLFDIILVRAQGPIGVARGAWDALRLKDLGDHPGGRVFWANGATVEVKATPEQPVELDGDPVGVTPVSASLEPRAVTVLVPRDR